MSPAHDRLHSRSAVGSAGSSEQQTSDVAALPVAFGRYQVRRALGAGSFGAVYLGHDTQLDRPVAIKVLRTGSASRRAKANGSCRRPEGSPNCVTPASWRSTTSACRRGRCTSSPITSTAPTSASG